jgi:hypothetical protein
MKALSVLLKDTPRETILLFLIQTPKAFTPSLLLGLRLFAGENILKSPKRFDRGIYFIFGAP